MYKFNSHVVYPSRNKRRVNSIRTTRERTSKSSIPKYIFARDTNSPQPLKDMNRLSKPNQPIDINGDAKVTHNVMHPDRTRILIHPNPLDGYAWTSKTYEVYIRTGKTNTCSADELLDCLTDWASTHQLVGVIGSLIKGEYELRRSKSFPVKIRKIMLFVPPVTSLGSIFFRIYSILLLYIE